MQTETSVFDYSKPIWWEVARGESRPVSFLECIVEVVNNCHSIAVIQQTEHSM